MSVTHARPSLRNLLALLFVLLTAIPVEIIGVLLTHRAWEQERETVREHHLQLAHYLTEALAGYADDMAATFQLIALNIADYSSVENLPTILDHLHFKYVGIVNSAGDVKHLAAPNTDFRIDRLPESFLQQLRIGGTRAAHAVRFSNVLPDRHGHPTLFLWKPIDDEHYAVGALNTDYIVKLQSTIRVGQSGHAIILDRSGRIIAHPNPQWRHAMKDMSRAEPVRRMMAGETGVLWFFSPDNQTEMVAGFATTPKTGWGVMIPQPVSELKTRIGQVQRAVWSVICLALLAAAVLSIFVARLLATPLRRIGLVAECFANGAYEVRISDDEAFHTRETANLAAQFNAMADEITRSWKAQQESEARSREFAEIAADWFWETDLQQVFTYISTPLVADRQWDAEQALWRHRREHIVNDPKGLTVALIQSYMDREASFDNVEYQVLGRGRRSIYISVAGRPIRDSKGEVVGYRGVARDITERLYTQAQLRQARQDEMLRHAHKMEAIGTLAGGIAHDFNNILFAIVGYTELTLTRLSRNTEAWRNLQEVLTAGKRAKELVRQILIFSRNSDQVSEPVYLHLVVKEALKLLRASLPTTITIRHDTPENIGAVLADPTQMHQVLMNLCVNAGYAMQETGGILDIRLDAVEVGETFARQHPTLCPGPHLRLTIQDTGQGMTPEVMDRIFEPYYTTKEVGQGTGMGLAIVHGIVTNHNGAITVQSRLGVGTTFEVYFPRHDEEVERLDRPEAPLSGGTGSILFVDDEETLALLGREMLRSLGYDVTAMMSSIDALEVFRHAPHRFDLVITDQTMPHMTGEMLACKLRQIRPDIPIILCTGFSHIMDAEKADAQDIDAFLMKPATAYDLGTTIQQLLPAQTVD